MQFSVELVFPDGTAVALLSNGQGEWLLGGGDSYDDFFGNRGLSLKNEVQYNASFRLTNITSNAVYASITVVRSDEVLGDRGEP